MGTEINNKVDIVIIGGGIAGCIAAIALARSYNVVVIDKVNKPLFRIGECLTPASRRILKKLDLLSGMDNIITATGQGLHLKNIGTQSYWGTEQMQIVDHLRNPDGFGWHLDRQRFENYLRESASKRGAICLWSTKFRDAHYEDCRWHINATTTDDTGNEKTYSTTAKFVIDASGRQAHFARKLGIKRQHFDKLVACWATLSNMEQNKMSTISASESGWWYSAPLPNNKRVIALQTDADLLDQKIINDCDLFIKYAQTNREIGNILQKNRGDIELHKTVSANSTRLNQFAGKQWAAIGDAAMSFDPLSSQGIFSAMISALELTEMIADTSFMIDLNATKMEHFQNIHTLRMDQIWASYLKQKNSFYLEEMRWKEAVFWIRRHN